MKPTLPGSPSPMSVGAGESSQAATPTMTTRRAVRITMRILSAPGSHAAPATCATPHPQTGTPPSRPIEGQRDEATECHRSTSVRGDCSAPGAPSCSHRRWARTGARAERRPITVLPLTRRRETGKMRAPFRRVRTMSRLHPPFRADQVGSLLRPQRLKDARERFQNNQITRDELRAAEDEAIRGVVKRQEAIGLQSITDGEFRRTFFHIDFLQRLQGVSVSGGIAAKFHTREGDIDFAPPRITVSGTLRHVQDIQTDAFRFLKSVATKTPKVTIPSPTMVHFRGGRKGIDIHAYPDLDEFFEDLAQVYREEVASLYDAGCRYIQFDDTNLAYLCDPQLRAQARERGDDPNELPYAYAALINAVVNGRPKDLTVAIHLCRGNFRSAW